MIHPSELEEESFRYFENTSENFLVDENISVNQFNVNEESVKLLRDDIIGSYSLFNGPFGEKGLVYSDWTASGRALNQVEEYIRDEVLPLYGNTHTTTSIAGHQSTCFRSEARQIVAQAVNARVNINKSIIYKRYI